MEEFREGNEVMICPQCGNACSDNSKFCEHCGCALNQAGADAGVNASAPATETIQAEPAQPAQSIWTKRNILIIASACAAALVIGVAGGLWVNGHDHDMALTGCANAVDAIRNSEKSVSSTLSSARQTAQVTGDQVADPKTLETLRNALSGHDRPLSASAYSCPADASTADLKTTAQLASSDADAQKHAIAAITKAAKAVEDSKATKSFDENKAALQSRIDEANKLFESSNGNVDGDGGRTALRSTIDAASSSLANASVRDAMKLSQALTSLNAAVDTVNKSVADHMAKVKAADSNHCAAWVGTYETLGSARDLVELHADCTGYSSMHQGIRQKMTYVPGSFKDSGGGRYVWSTTTSYVAIDDAYPEDVASANAEPSTTRRFEIIPASGSSTGMIIHDLSYVPGTEPEEAYFAPSGYSGGIPR